MIACDAIVGKRGLNDPARLAALRRLELLDSAQELTFDRLVRLGQQFLKVPVCVISLVDDKRQFFKAQVGLSGEMKETRQGPLSHSFCQYVVDSGQLLVVEDARADPIVCRNPAVTEYNILAYIGCPLRSPDGLSSARSVSLKTACGFGRPLKSN